MVVQAEPIVPIPPHGRGISLSSSELRKLRRIARNPKAEPGARVNAKAILLAAQACSNQQIAEKLELPLCSVDRLRERFARCRLAALNPTPDVVLPPLDDMLPVPAGKAIPVRLLDYERARLEATVRASTAEQRAVLRAKVVLLAAQGRNNCEIADELRVDLKTVRKWRSRFAAERLGGLYDLARAGRPAKFEASHRLEAIAAMLTAAPETYARWTLDLAVEAIIDGKILPSISRETLSRWLRSVHTPLRSASSLPPARRISVRSTAPLVPAVMVRIWSSRPLTALFAA
jgi:transposase